MKQLLWLQDRDNDMFTRMKFSGLASAEALLFLETFLPYHLEKELRSLSFLRKIRKNR